MSILVRRIRRGRRYCVWLRVRMFAEDVFELLEAIKVRFRKDEFGKRALGARTFSSQAVERTIEPLIRRRAWTLRLPRLGLLCWFDGRATRDVCAVKACVERRSLGCDVNASDIVAVRGPKAVNGDAVSQELVVVFVHLDEVVDCLDGEIRTCLSCGLIPLQPLRRRSSAAGRGQVDGVVSGRLRENSLGSAQERHQSYRRENDPGSQNAGLRNRAARAC